MKSLCHCQRVAALLLVLPFSPLQADVEALQIRLTANFSSDFYYSVPNGKVLIIEQIIFNDYWDNSANDKEIRIRREGISFAGQTCCTTLSYNGANNSLLRPLKLPGGTAIAVQSLGNDSYRCYVYGLLADSADLFAAKQHSIEKVGLTGRGAGRSASAAVAAVTIRMN